jgi:hypothetical protein
MCQILVHKGGPVQQGDVESRQELLAVVQPAKSRLEIGQGKLVAIQKIEVARGEISPFCFTGLKPAGIRHHGWLKATSSALTAPASTAAAILPPRKQGAVS